VEKDTYKFGEGNSDLVQSQLGTRYYGSIGVVWIYKGRLGGFVLVK
jgi:hypothetical protein